MIDALLEKLAGDSGAEVVMAAGEHLADKIKNSKDINKVFVDTGEFFIDFEPQAEQLFQDMSSVLSKENMINIANELKTDSGYTLKDRLLNALIMLMDKYEIPREYATFYANNILYPVERVRQRDAQCQGKRHSMPFQIYLLDRHLQWPHSECFGRWRYDFIQRLQGRFQDKNPPPSGEESYAGSLCMSFQRGSAGFGTADIWLTPVGRRISL